MELMLTSKGRVPPAVWPPNSVSLNCITTDREPNSRHFFLMALEVRSPDQGSSLVPDENSLLGLQTVAFLLRPQGPSLVCACIEHEIPILLFLGGQ